LKNGLPNGGTLNDGVKKTFLVGIIGICALAKPESKSNRLSDVNGNRGGRIAGNGLTGQNGNNGRVGRTNGTGSGGGPGINDGPNGSGNGNGSG